MEATVAVGSIAKEKYEQKSSCRVPTLTRSSDRYWNGRAWLQCSNAWHNWVLLLTCDHILKFDWYCQLSGSRSNSLNSCKLPGHFSYDLGTRLTSSISVKQLLLWCV